VLLHPEAWLAITVVMASRSAGAGVPPVMRNWTEACRGAPEVNSKPAMTVFTVPGPMSPRVQGIPPVQSSDVETRRSAGSTCASSTTPVAVPVPRLTTWTMNRGGCPLLYSCPSVVAPMASPLAGDHPTSSSAAGVRSIVRERLGLMVGIISRGGEALESQWPTLEPSE